MASKSPPLPGPVLEALKRGDTAEAVRLMRGVSGWAPNTAQVPSLRSASPAPDTLSVSTATTASRPAKAPPASVDQPLAGPVFSSGLPPLVVDALQRGEKIQAMRLMREITGVGLKAAKDAIDASPHAAAQIGLSPGEVPRTGRTIWLLVAAALLAWLAWMALRSPG